MIHLSISMSTKVYNLYLSSVIIKILIVFVRRFWASSILGKFVLQLVHYITIIWTVSQNELFT